MGTACDQCAPKKKNLPEIENRVTDVVVKKGAGRNGALLKIS